MNEFSIFKYSLLEIIHTMDLINPTIFNVSKITPKVDNKIKSNITITTDEEKITVTLTDENSNPLANKKVIITVNGKTYTKTTDSNE